MPIVQRFLRAWSALMRGVRAGLARTKILAAWDRWAARSRVGLWLRSQLSVYDVEDFVTLDLPWWTLDSASLVDEFLSARPGARVFEWGSGASTIWLEKRATEVISVEYDPEWAQLMQTIVGPGTTVVEVSASTDTHPEISSGMWGHTGLDYSDYVAAIDAVRGNFDLIVIDGRARTACLDKAVERLTPGGMIVFDNTNRARYREALESVGPMFESTTTSGLTPALPWSTRTTLLRKNHS